MIGTEDAYKLREVGPVSVLLAGHQARAENLLRGCSASIRIFSNAAFAPDFTEGAIDTLLDGLREAARQKKMELVRHHIEMSTGIAFEEFKKLSAASPNAFIDTWSEIKSLTLGADLLISCVPPKSEAIIVRLDRWGYTHWESHYAAIGEGSDIARALLCLQPWDASGRHGSSGGGPEPTLGQCLFRVYEAKRTAHTA